MNIVNSNEIVNEVFVVSQTNSVFSHLVTALLAIFHHGVLLLPGSHYVENSDRKEEALALARRLIANHLSHVQCTMSAALVAASHACLPKL